MSRSLVVNLLVGALVLIAGATMLVGSIGLIAAVPMTTAIAALHATRIDAWALETAHGHAH